MTDKTLIQNLKDTPVQGVSFARVSVLRLDLVGGAAPGNKIFKLRENLAVAKAQGIRRIVSFGGAWSNHLHALAAVGHELGLETVGLIRGERPATPSAMLRDVAALGMQLEFLPRDQYRLRDNPDYLAAIAQRHPASLIIPEGGANAAGVAGCRAIADLIAGHTTARTVLLAVGTGTTMAGVVAGLGPAFTVIGIPVLKGLLELGSQLRSVIAQVADQPHASWQLEPDYHCGGYARVSAGLKAFMLEFEQVQSIALDPVYTGKVFYAVQQMLAAGTIEGEVLVIHTGGLQGRRGFDWLGTTAIN